MEKLVIFDGAMGTTLYSKGVMQDCMELVNLEKPQIIEEIHKSFVDCGANYVKANTFGANKIKLDKVGEADKLIELNQSAVKLAKQSGGLVAGDIGPCGELYMPYGMVSTKDIYESYLAQVKALGDVDMYLIETMSSLIESNLAYLAIKSYNKDAKIIMSFTFTNGFTMMGCTPQSVAKATNNLDLFALGVNCSGGADELYDVAKVYTENSIHKISVMPNAGLPVMNDNGEVEYPYSAEEFGKAMSKIIDLGVEVVGGCCGTTPAHIGALTEFNKAQREVIEDKNIYIANEREFIAINKDNTVDCENDMNTILEIEESGKVARIDLSDIVDIETAMNDINMMSTKPKCFKSNENQILNIKINYQGITDIVID